VIWEALTLAQKKGEEKVKRAARHKQSMEEKKAERAAKCPQSKAERDAKCQQSKEIKRTAKKKMGGDGEGREL
jgi:hypothetical protein